LHRPSVRYRRTAALSLLGWNGNWTCPRVTLPSHRFCRPSGYARRVSAPAGRKGSGAWDSHPPGRLHRPECCWLHHHLEKRSSGRSRTGMVFFTKEVHFWLCHGGIKYCRPQVCSREDLHLEPSPSHGDMQGSYTSGAGKRLHHAGAAPAHAVWKTAMRAATSMTCEMVAEFGIALN